MDQEYEELYKWVEEHQITRPKRNINRDFSDAIPLVEILKHHFPKLVDLHNYTPKNAYTQKLVNWQTVNNKVLKKLKIGLSNTDIDHLAKATPGAIEKLLQKIRKKVDEKNAEDEDESLNADDSLNSPNSKISTRRSNKKVVQITVWNKMESDLKEKTEAIEILKCKVDHLENLLNIKDERIKDLNQQLQNVVNGAMESPSRSKFLNMF